MRLDKYLKVSRIIKRRTVAQSACEGGLVSVNGKTQKSAYNVKQGDNITVRMGRQPLSVRVLKLDDSAKKTGAADMYEVIGNE